MASERQTKNWIAKPLITELPYPYFGNLQHRPDNYNIINDQLRQYLRGRGYSPNPIGRTVH